jgi:hypothetical protein
VLRDGVTHRIGVALFCSFFRGCGMLPAAQGCALGEQSNTRSGASRAPPATKSQMLWKSWVLTVFFRLKYLQVSR